MAKGIPSERIVLGGFSQGGAMSLLSGLTCPHKLGGIFGLSCYLLLKDKLRDMLPEGNANAKTKVFMGHGDADMVVRYEWGSKTADVLKEWGWEVDFRTYAYVYLFFQNPCFEVVTISFLNRQRNGTTAEYQPLRMTVVRTYTSN